MYENANAPPIWIVALSFAPPPCSFGECLDPQALSKILSKALIARTCEPASSSFFVVDVLGFAKPAVADAVSVGVECRDDAEREERRVEDLGGAEREAAWSPGLTAEPNLMRAMPPRVSFSSAPS